MRYVIYGTGAIGGILGARLLAAGHRVVFIARGNTLEVLRRDGLRLRSPGADHTVAVDAVEDPAAVGIAADDVVIMATKSQDAPGAITALAGCAPADVVVFCAQNGVANERLALRCFRNVYGMFVYVFGLHLSPAVVQCYTAPSFGVVDLGRCPGGIDEMAHRTAGHLVAAGFDCIARRDIMRWKHGKLLANLANVLHAACGPDAPVADVLDQARLEGEACFRAAGIPYATADERTRRIAALQPLQTIDGAPFPGGSSWQSLARGTGNMETDFLNGEVVLLGRLHGVPTPANEMLQSLARRMAQQGMSPGSLAPGDVRALLAATDKTAAAD